MLLAALLAQLHKLVVFDLVVINHAARYLYGTCGNVVYESAVMAYQNHSVATLGQKLLEPLYALYVQMVGRLVQKQHVRMTQQYLGQFYTHAPASAELACGAVKIFAAESKTQHGLLQFGLIVASSHHLVAFALAGKTVYEGVILLTLIVGALNHLVVQTLNLGL